MNDINQIRELYCEMLQNCSLFSPAYGKAEIYKGLPFYCDGKSLLVVGYTIDESKRNISQSEFDSYISEVVSIARDRCHQSLKSIEFWGPRRPRNLEIPDFIQIRERRPDKSNCDVILTLDAASMKRIKEGRDIRRALRNDLKVEINFSKKTTAEHSVLFEMFFKKHSNIEPEDIPYLMSWKQVLENSDSFLFEVRRNGHLTGFSILNCFGKHTATYAYGFFDNTAAGTSDLIHAEMIGYCHNRGFDNIDLGYSIDSNLLRYKRKWGNTRLVDPPWSVYWQLRDNFEKRQVVNS